DGIRDRNVTGVQTCALPISIGRIMRAAPFTHIAGNRNSGGSAMPRPHRLVPLLFAVAVSGFLGAFTLAVDGQTGATEAPAGFDRSEERRVGKEWRARRDACP